MSYEVTKGPGIELVHCIPGMSYEVTKGLGIELVHGIPGMSYEVIINLPAGGIST